MMISKILLIGAYLAALVSVLIGIVCFTSIPRHLGVWRLYQRFEPAMIGLTPAFHDGIPWNYTWEEWWNGNVNLTDKVAIVTGANSGIGYDLASALAVVGASVTMVCRNEERCKAARTKLLQERADNAAVKEENVKIMIMDTSSLASVRAFAETYIKEYGQEPIDFLYMNAGINFLPAPGEDTKCSPNTKEDGIEYLFQVNYLGHHLMYRLLEPFLGKETARIIQTSSASSFSTFSYKVATDLETLHGCSEPFIVPATSENLSYGQSKLAQILWVKALTRQNSKVIANSFHPGLVDTPIIDKILDGAQAGQWMRQLFSMMKGSAWKSPDGALTGLYLAVVDGVKGRYFHPQAQEVINPLSLDEKLQDDLWKFSDELVKDYLAPIEFPATDTATENDEVAEEPVQEEPEMPVTEQEQLQVHSPDDSSETEGSTQEDADETATADQTIEMEAPLAKDEM